MTDRVTDTSTYNGTAGGLIAADGTAHFVYQRIHLSAGKPLHLSAHLDIVARAFQHIYGDRPDLDAGTVATRIADHLSEHRIRDKGSAVMMLYVVPREKGGPDLRLEYERALIDRGYSLSVLRPRAVGYDYSIPFGGFPTGFQLSARSLFDTLALSHHGATRSVRREGDKLISCGDAPLFGIRGKTLFTAPIIEGATDSVERRLVIAAASRARLDFLEEAVPHSELKDFDELLFADPRGITSLSECDGAKFMSLYAARLAAAM